MGSQGRDSGFLTYFFGQQPHHGSPEPHGLNRPHSHGGTPRSGSPTREMFANAGDMDLRSDDGLAAALTSSMHMAERDELEVELIRSLIASYFQVTRKTVADLVPKAIMHMLVNYGRENLQSRLVTTLYKEELFDQLLTEDARVQEERNKCKQILETYRRGAALLQDIFQ